jgi:hypothetical protein
MGNTSSGLYDNVLELSKNPYFIYEYNDVAPGIFKIDPDINEKEEEIYLSIREVIPITTEDFDKKINPIIDINSGITYKEMEDDIKEDVPHFVVEKYSDMIYLGYLYSTKTRSGTYYEKLISNIGKDLGAAGIHLYDASRGGKCKNFSLSIQLFISEKKRYNTYYETLGYHNLDINYRTIKKKTSTLIEKYKEVPVKEIIKDIHKDVDRVMKKTELGWSDISFIAYHNNILTTMKKYGNKNLPLLEYLNDLVVKDKCNVIEVLMESELHFKEENKYTIILKNLYQMSYGKYVKYF